MRQARADVGGTQIEAIIAAERACSRLCLEFTRSVDTGAYEAAAALFTEDGEFTRRGSTFRGHEAIARSFDEILGGWHGRARNPSWRVRHLCTNIMIDVVSPTEATGVSYYTIYLYKGPDVAGLATISGPGLIGDYVDRFVRTGDGWRISRREARSLLAGPGA